MADQAVGELIQAQSIGATDLFVLEQGGVAKCLKGQVLLNWLTAAADGHGGIQSVDKTGTSGLVDTYTITLADTTTVKFTVTNGKGITGNSKTGTSGLVDTYTITYNDGTSTTYTVTNGEKGDKGDTPHVYYKWASQEPTEESHSMGDVPDAWQGIYAGYAEEAPTDWKQYVWYKVKGEKGDKGDPATLDIAEVTYQSSTSGQIIPSGEWSTTIPVVAQGNYLWTRTVKQFNTGDPIIEYSIARQGKDGTGSVSSVAGVSPDTDGNVPLTADNIGALPNSGGSMTGTINMNGQPITGLNDPTEDTQAARKGYVDNAASKASTPYNLLDNSDFAHFVAQAGIGGSHGTQAYAGDRWILDSGTVTGEENANGDGYSGITLNGTIRQKLANVPSVATVGIEMVSGSATISYADGAVTVTSSGGVIKDAWCYSGSYTADNMPEYVPNGYAVELEVCKRYFNQIESWAQTGAGAVDYLGNTANIVIPIGVTMRTNPTSYGGLADSYLRINGNSVSCANASVTARTSGAYLILNVAVAGLTSYGNYLAEFDVGNTPMQLLADLP